MLLEHLDPLDRVLEMHAVELGGDFTAYRNHAYRVVNFCCALAPCADASLEKVALAAAFHDLGIWTAQTFDYLAPSIRLACSHLACSDHADWRDNVAGMIREHHKVRTFRGTDAELIEPFRRADWMDVSLGVLSFGCRARAFARFARSGRTRGSTSVSRNSLSSACARIH
jgi:hypothetical protein